MKTHLAGRLFVAWALVMCARAQDAKPGAVDKQDKALEARQVSTVTFSTGIADILKMADAKVSPDVIRTYIERASIAYNPTATDIIALKEHGVSDDITAALVKRGSEGRGQAGPAGTGSAVPQAALGAANPNAAAPSYVESYPGYGSLDPESYDFFTYYYLYPRTLASVYERLSPYHPGFYYGYYQPWSFRPYFTVRHSFPHRGGFPPVDRHRTFQRSPGFGNQSSDRFR